jgi:hypothetical protein
VPGHALANARRRRDFGAAFPEDSPASRRRRISRSTAPAIILLKLTRQVYIDAMGAA